MEAAQSDAQSIATAVLVPIAIIFAVFGWRARRAGRTDFGLGLRSGALAEFTRGMLFSVPFLAVLVLLFWATGLSGVAAAGWNAGSVLGIWIYFLILFLVEEIIFRGLLLTGLGVLTGQAAAIGITSVAIALPYALAPETGVLPVLGSVLANLLHGWARWRSGRIWWGLGQRWTWNSGMVTVGFANSAFLLEHPVLTQDLHGPDWLTGGGFGVEGGLIGYAFLILMIIGTARFGYGRQRWEITPATAPPEDDQRSSAT